MNHVTPYEYLLGFAAIGTLISAIEMADALRLIILVLTAIGTVIKLIEQVYKSKESLSSFINSICTNCRKIWKKIKGQK